MQNEPMNATDPQTDAEATAAAFGTTTPASTLFQSVFVHARSSKPDCAVLYCTRCGGVNTADAQATNGLLQLVAVPADMADEDVPEGHDIVLPPFDPASQYIKADNVCPMCAAGLDEWALMHLTIETPTPDPADEPPTDTLG